MKRQKKDLTKLSERPHVALPVMSLEPVRPNAHTTIEVETQRPMILDEMAIARTSDPFFDVEVSVAGRQVPLSKMPDCEIGGTGCYDMPKTPIAKGAKIAVMVHNRDDQPHVFHASMLGVL